MKTLRYLLLIITFTLIQISCTPSSEKAINPGDITNDLKITIGTADEAKAHYLLNAFETSDNENPIEVAWGTKLVASEGVYDDQYSGKLDEIWSTLNYELYINDPPVNLPAFGTIEKSTR